MRHARTGDEHFAAAFGGDGLDRFKEQGLHAYVIPGGNKPGAMFRHAAFLRHFIAEHQITLIHAHHRYFDLLGRALRIISKVRVVTSVHSKVYGKRFISYLAPNLIAPGERIKEHLELEFRVPPERISVIKNFVCPDDFTLPPGTRATLTRESLNINSDSIVLLFSARMSKEKGIDILLTVLKELENRRNDFFCIIAGDGEERGFVEEYCMQHLKRCMVLKSQMNMVDLYSLADIVLLPSRVDPFPLVMIEAGAMRKAFLGSCVDGIGEFIVPGETGVLVPPENPEKLLEAMENLIDNKSLREELAQKLHTFVSENYSCVQRIPLYFALYDKIVQVNHGN